MAQSTLNLTTAQLRTQVARFCGFGNNVAYASMTSVQQANVDRLIASGLRRFYNPMPLPGDVAPHEWSFLSPTTTLSLVASTASYDLPDGFGGMLGPFFWSGNDGRAPIVTMNDAEFMRRRSTGSSDTGTPSVAMITPKATTGESPDETPNIPTIFQVTFWPTPDASGTLTYRYYALQNTLSDTVAPPGAMMHGETMLAMCYAAAAEEYRSEADAARFERIANERLAASIWADRRTSGRTHFGMNVDRSDFGGMSSRNVQTTYNNTLY